MSFPFSVDILRISLYHAIFSDIYTLKTMSPCAIICPIITIKNSAVSTFPAPFFQKQCNYVTYTSFKEFKITTNDIFNYRSFFFLKKAMLTTTIRAHTIPVKGYAHFSSSSGMYLKFIPYQPTMRVSGMNILEITVR